ncbi:hypothetical protein [Microbacterium lacusdiani]
MRGVEVLAQLVDDPAHARVAEAVRALAAQGEVLGELGAADHGDPVARLVGPDDVRVLDRLEEHAAGFSQLSAMSPDAVLDVMSSMAADEACTITSSYSAVALTWSLKTCTRIFVESAGTTNAPRVRSQLLVGTFVPKKNVPLDPSSTSIRKPALPPPLIASILDAKSTTYVPPPAGSVMSCVSARRLVVVSVVIDTALLPGEVGERAVDLDVDVVEAHGALHVVDHRLDAHVGGSRRHLQARGHLVPAARRVEAEELGGRAGERHAHAGLGVLPSQVV